MGDTLFFQITLLGIQNVVKRGNSCRRQKPPWCCLSTFSTDSCGEGARQLYPSPQYLYWCLWNPGLSRRLLSPVAPSPLPPLGLASLQHGTVALSTLQPLKRHGYGTGTVPLWRHSVDVSYSDRRGCPLNRCNPPLQEVVTRSTEEFFH